MKFPLTNKLVDFFDFSLTQIFRTWPEYCQNLVLVLVLVVVFLKRKSWMSISQILNEVSIPNWNLMEKPFTVQICISFSVYWTPTRTIVSILPLKTHPQSTTKSQHMVYTMVGFVRPTAYLAAICFVGYFCFAVIKITVTKIHNRNNKME